MSVIATASAKVTATTIASTKTKANAGVLRCAQNDKAFKARLIENKQRQVQSNSKCKATAKAKAKATATANAGFFPIRIAQGQNDKAFLHSCNELMKKSGAITAR